MLWGGCKGLILILEVSLLSPNEYLFLRLELLLKARRRDGLGTMECHFCSIAVGGSSPLRSPLEASAMPAGCLEARIPFLT